ncbi:hypothetical protein PT974_07975 [Cladobotryum mycophilum]|uniref:Uncharacterized protein n=1 Tax=Cladobotryum mycophilum TaxID=491253 RepID=A0ABR0SD00_9HYPO
MSRQCLYLLLSMAVPAAALFQNTNSSEFWDNFANNFASDLAPIISLFGEQVTKQFLTESTTSLDYVLFAMAPLGVLTAVVSVIRVRGSSTLKSIIGRAREPHALAEVELCSSTSQDVCELWSNGGICRVFGRPKILEFMFRKPNPDDFYPSFLDTPWNSLRKEPTCGIELPQDVLGPLRPNESKLAMQFYQASNFGQWEEVASSDAIWSPIERYIRPFRKAKPDLGSELQMWGTTIEKQKRRDKFAPHPNPSLNIGRRGLMLSIINLWIASVFGILVQASLFLYATWATWYHSKFYAGGVGGNILPFFTLGVSGTVFLMAGMALSAKLIDTKSEERRFVDCAKEPGSLIFWLQPAQRIGDQRFNAFAHVKKCGEYITSWKLERKDAKESDSANDILVWTSVALSLLGWAAQFIGLRGMHPSISLYSLVCTLIMSFIRAMIRSSQFDDRENLLQELGQHVEDHELDWQAFYISQLDGLTPGKTVDKGFFIEEHFDLLCETGNTPPMSNSAYRFSRNGFLGLLTMSIIPDHLMEHACNQLIKFMENYSGSGFVFNQGQHNMSRVMMLGHGGDDEISPNESAKLVRTRLRLAQLTSEPLLASDQTWGTEIRRVALKLKAVLEKSADYIFSNKVFPGLHRNEHDAILWTLTCCSPEKGSKDILCFSMLKQNGNWKMDANLLEATLSLWHWSLQERLRALRKKSPSYDFNRYFTKKRLVFDTKRWFEADLIFKLWVLQGPTSETHLAVSIKAQHPGNLSIPAALCMIKEQAEGSSMGASDLNMFSADAESSLLHLMAQDLFAVFVNRFASLLVKTNLKFTNITSEYERIDSLSLSTSGHADALVDILVSEGLATKQEALMTVIPSLFPEGLFSKHQLLSWALSQAETMKMEKKFRESEKILTVLLNLSMTPNKRRPELAMCELYRSEFRWMIRNPQLKRRDLTNRYYSFRKQARSAFGHDGDVYLDVFKLMFPQIDSSWDANELARVLPRETGQQPLSEEKLEELNLDRWSQYASGPRALTIALVLDERYDLSRSPFTVRLQLLRWAIEVGSLGLMQDLRDCEKRSNLRSVFFDGPDTVLWAIVTHEKHKCTVDIINFLINVAEVNISTPVSDMLNELIPNADLEDEMTPTVMLHALAWTKSKKRDEIRKSYDTFGSVLAAAAVMPAPENAEVVTLLVDRIGYMPRRSNRRIELSRELTSGDYGNALVAAVCGVSSETFMVLLDQYCDGVRERLRSGLLYHVRMDFLNDQLSVGRFGTVVIAAAYWGRRDCLERILATQRDLLDTAKKYRGTSDALPGKVFEDVVVTCGTFKTPMEAAKAPLSNEDKRWAESRFEHEKEGVVELLTRWMAEERSAFGQAEVEA